MSGFSFYESALFGAPRLHKCNNVRKDITRLAKADSLESDDSFKIVIVLDESGSMESIKSNMIKSINDFIKEQKQVKSEKECRFTLIKFSDKVKRVIENKPLEGVSYLTTEDYRPNGSTALYDAIGDTIERYKNMEDLLMVIVTDGQENASKDYTKHEITKMIENKKRYDGWTYVYLSCDLGTFEQGNNLGFTKSSYATNAVRGQHEFGFYMANDLNDAVKMQRINGTSVQEILNR